MGPRYGLFYSHGWLSRMYILQCLGIIFCRYLLSAFDVWCQLILVFSFCPDDLSCRESEILKSPFIGELMLISSFTSNRGIFIKLESPECGAYMFQIQIFSWLTLLLIGMKCLYYLLISFFFFWVLIYSEQGTWT